MDSYNMCRVAHMPMRRMYQHQNRPAVVRNHERRVYRTVACSQLLRTSTYYETCTMIAMFGYDGVDDTVFAGTDDAITCWLWAFI